MRVTVQPAPDLFGRGGPASFRSPPLASSLEASTQRLIRCATDVHCIVDAVFGATGACGFQNPVFPLALSRRRMDVSALASCSCPSTTSIMTSHERVVLNYLPLDPPTQTPAIPFLHLPAQAPVRKKARARRRASEHLAWTVQWTTRWEVVVKSRWSAHPKRSHVSPVRWLQRDD